MQKLCSSNRVTVTTMNHERQETFMMLVIWQNCTLMNITTEFSEVSRAGELFYLWYAPVMRQIPSALSFFHHFFPHISITVLPLLAISFELIVRSLLMLYFSIMLHLNLCFNPSLCCVCDTIFRLEEESQQKFFSTVQQKNAMHLRIRPCILKVEP